MSLHNNTYIKFISPHQIISRQITLKKGYKPLPTNPQLTCQTKKSGFSKLSFTKIDSQIETSFFEASKPYTSVATR